MRTLTKGKFGVVLGVGLAAAIIFGASDLAVGIVIAAVAVIAATVVYRRVDRPPAH